MESIKSLEKRVEALENEIAAKTKPPRLFDWECNEIGNAEILRMPTGEREGLARLANGSEMPIILEKVYDDSEISVIWRRKSTAGKLRAKRGETVCIVNCGDADIDKILIMGETEGKEPR